jgi:hypothetical protein
MFCRRRHQPSRPPSAKIRPGRPAPAIGPGTVVKTTGPDVSAVLGALRSAESNGEGLRRMRKSIEDEGGTNVERNARPGVMVSIPLVTVKASSSGEWDRKRES